MNFSSHKLYISLQKRHLYAGNLMLEQAGNAGHDVNA